MSKEITRRSFLKTGTAVAAGLAVAPNIIIAGEKTPKKEKKKKVALQTSSTSSVSVSEAAEQLTFPRWKPRTS